MPAHLERRGRVALLTLDDPDRRNALTLPLVDEIVAAVDECEAADDVGALVVTGAPPAFCAGADLSDLAGAGDGGQAERALRSIYEGFLRIARCPLPTLAAVNGPAVGAGLNLALGCDVRLAGESARFDSRFLQLGLHPGGGHTWLMAGLTGPQSSAATVLFGERLDGRRAVEVGLAWDVVADDDLVEAAVDLAGRAADLPRALAVRAKETLRRMGTVTEHAEAVDVELEAQLWSVGQPEFRRRLDELARRISSRTPDAG